MEPAAEFAVLLPGVRTSKISAWDHAALIVLSNVTRRYQSDIRQLTVLANVSLQLERGECCAIVGSSGAGKSTLLHILGLLDRPDSGSFTLAGRDVAAASADELAWLRNREIGFVFQAFNLLPHLTALDNVALPLFYRGMDRESARALAMAQLRNVDLAPWALHRPADLSGGQRQRAAIARALVGTPSILLADEPTGNLDAASAEMVLELLLELNRQRGLTLIVVTHDLAIAARCARQIEVRDGGLWERHVSDESLHG